MLSYLRFGLAAFLIARGSFAADPFTGLKAVDSLIEAAIAEDKIPGAVLLVGHGGQVVYRKAYGRRALVPSSEPMTVDTIFDCASLTKVVATTSSLMKLFDAGKLRLDDKVTAYLPEFQNGKSDITIRDLMTHYSGFQPDFDLDPPWSGYASGIERALREVPVAPRNTKFIYSDTNFILLGEIVHRLSGIPLDQFAVQQIFRPLGMTETMFNPPASLLPRIAPTERQKDGQIIRGIVHDPRSRLMGGVAGHAGMFSTADDLGRFCQMMLNKGVNPSADATRPPQIFNPNTVDLFTSPQSPAGLPAVRGLGWDINSPYSGNRGELFPAGTSYGHTGFTGVSLWLDPTSQTYVVLLTNAVHPEVRKPITALRKSVATAVAEAVGYPPHVKHVRTGLDVLEGEHFARLAGKRVGLITNQTGIDSAGRRNVDVMRADGVKISAIFSPEHGFSGLEDKPDVDSGADKTTGIRVWSLFSQKTHRPTAEMLRDVDVVVFDIADIGARFYTYSTTMAYAMEACAQQQKPIFVLDRPNPITGLHVEGPVLDPANESFVGYFPMAVRHGMTIGELARMFNAENRIGANLTVVPMVDWNRGDWFDSTGLPWVNPSPNIRSLTEALLFPAIGMLEYSTNYSVGRGTATPFEWVGSTWMEGGKLSAYLNSRQIPGVKTYPAKFTPSSNHYAGTNLEAIRFEITDRDLFDSAQLGLNLAAAFEKLYQGQLDFSKNRRLIGNNEVVAELGDGEDPNVIRNNQEGRLKKFLEVREKYLLYP